MIWLLGGGVVLGLVIIGLYVASAETEEERAHRIIKQINERN